MVAILESQFHNAMKEIYKRAKKECSYDASQFLNMISNDGGLKTAKRLLEAKEIQYGFTEIWECGRLDLTVEAHVLKPEFKTLFSEAEIAEAKARLESHGYFENLHDKPKIDQNDIDKKTEVESSRYQVSYLESDEEPVDKNIIEEMLNSMADKGWTLKQLNSGGNVKSEIGKYWVYVVFEKLNG
jgi:hypothetical protein